MLDINASLLIKHLLSGYEIILIFLAGAVVQCLFHIAFFCLLGESKMIEFPCVCLNEWVYFVWLK